jgi:hypothetical protein
MKTAGYRTYFALLLSLLLARTAFGLSLDPKEQEMPKLLPPRGELPVPFWEQYGGWVVLGGIVGLALIAALVWLLTRPRPAVVEPPEIIARHELEALRRQPETGVILSRVSQVVRHYFGAAFGLPPGELTTAEFCRAVGSAEQVGPELSTAVGGFLRECDERKFSPVPPASAPKAVPQAFELLARAEARKAQLQAAAAAAAGPVTQAAPPPVPEGVR